MSARTGEQHTAQSIRRILRELREIRGQRNPLWTAWPIDEDEPYEWHFTVKGPPGSAFEGGIYHGRIVLPINYPMAPPALYFFTNNGRFEIHRKVCLSASNYHPESWQPAWGIRSMLEALVAFFPTPAEGAVNSLNWSDSVRRSLALQSVHYKCSTCNKTNANIVAEYCDPVNPDNGHGGECSRVQVEASLVEDLESNARNLTSSPSVQSPTPAPLRPFETACAQASGNDCAQKSSKERPLGPDERRETDRSPDADVEESSQDKVARYEEIARRRAPNATASGSIGALEGFHPNTPVLLIFTYWLIYFLSQSIWRSLRRSLSRPYFTNLSYTSTLFFIVVGWSCWILYMYALRLMRHTFFLSEVPLSITLQDTTTGGPLRDLTLIQRTEDFRLHPVIDYIIKSLCWLRQSQ